MTTSDDRLQVLYDTTVFCGAFVNPDGANMRVLLLGAAGLYQPIVSQAVLQEFVHVAVGQGLGRQRRRYAYEVVRSWLVDDLAPLLEHARPVALRNALPDILRNPHVTIRRNLQNALSRWPTDIAPDALVAATRDMDLGDWHVIAAALEYGPDVVVTSNIEDLRLLENVCAVETPTQFLRRFVD